MAFTDNPAGRLHGLLEKYGKSGGSIERAWAAVLNVPVDELGLHLGRVGLLFEDVKRAYEDLEEPGGWEKILDSLQTLSRCVWPRTTAMNQPVTQASPDAVAMTLLGAFSSHLHSVASEGVTPAAETIMELEDEVRDLLGSVAASALDPWVRRMMQNRLDQVLEALGHLNVGGPDAVRRATEALAAACVLYGEAMAADADDEAIRATAETVLKVKKVAAKAFNVFLWTAKTIGAVHGIASGTHTIEHLLGLNEQLILTGAQPPALPPGEHDGDGPAGLKVVEGEGDAVDDDGATQDADASEAAP